MRKVCVCSLFFFTNTFLAFWQSQNERICCECFSYKLFVIHWNLDPLHVVPGMYKVQHYSMLVWQEQIPMVYARTHKSAFILHQICFMPVNLDSFFQMQYLKSLKYMYLIWLHTYVVNLYIINVAYSFFSHTHSSLQLLLVETWLWPCVCGRHHHMTLTQTQLVMWVYLTSTDGTTYKCQHPSGRVLKRVIDIYTSY